jgi:hypothetical protein
MRSLEQFKAERGGQEPLDLRFWKAEEPHVTVFAHANKLSSYANWRKQRAFFLACLYGDTDLAASIQGADALDNGVPQTMTINVCRRQADTYQAHIVKNRSKPMALTTGGNYGARRRAEAITKFGQGMLETVQFWPTRELRTRDHAVWGSGFARNHRVGRKLCHDRVYQWEVLVDPRDAFYGSPRTVLITRSVDRMLLTEQHPEFEEQIKQAKRGLSGDELWGTTFGTSLTDDTVLVIEAIHLPSRTIEDGDEKEHDGAYAKCISNATLTGDPKKPGAVKYLRDHFGLSKSDYQKPLTGWFGEGLVEQLAGLQYEINANTLRMQEGGFLTGTYVWTADQGGVEVDLLENTTLGVIRSASRPEFFQPAPWHPQALEYIEGLITRRPSDITGQTSFSTRGEIPAGMDGASGVALRRYKDEGSENMIVHTREDERDTIDTMWQLLDLAEEIGATEQKGVSVRYEVRDAGRSSFESIDYKAVRMDRKEFTLQAFPMSYLSGTPSDRWAQVSEMADKGYFGTDEAMSLLDFPDLQRVLNLRNSPRKVVEKVIEKLLDPKFEGTIAPESAMNLDLCVALGALAYLEAKWLDEAPEKLCKRVLQFSIAARQLRDGGSAAQTGMGPQPGSQDPGALPGEVLPPEVNVPGQPPPLPGPVEAPMPMPMPEPGGTV